MQTTTTIEVKVFFDREERFVVPAMSFWDIAPVRLQVHALTWNPDKPEAVSVRGYKFLPDGSIDRLIATDYQAKFADLPYTVRQSLAYGGVADMGYTINAGLPDSTTTAQEG